MLIKKGRINSSEFIWKDEGEQENLLRELYFGDILTYCHLPPSSERPDNSDVWCLQTS